MKLLGRWTRADFSGGFDLLEADEAAALTKFALRWNDLMHLEVVPVVEDAQLAGVLARAERAAAAATAPPGPVKQF